MAYCPSCGSAHVAKAGFKYTELEVKRRWRCADCFKQWTDVTAATSKMKLQESLTEIADKMYRKYQIVIPENMISLLGWKKGVLLEGRVKERRLLVVRERPNQETHEFSYGEFKEAVTKVLSNAKEGLVWTQLRKRASLPQKTPSPIWVNRLEKAHLLRRIKDKDLGKTIWFGTKMGGA